VRTIRKTALMAAVAATALVSVAKVARADAFTWDGSDAAINANWSNGLNWTSTVPDAAPAAAADTIIFNETGDATVPNVVDAGLATKTFAALSYVQNTKSYTTQIGAGLTLGTTTGLTVMPTLASTPTVASVAQVTFTGNRLVVLRNFNVTGRPTNEAGAVAGALESRAIVDLTGLTEFAYIRGVPAGPGITETNFNVGRGTGGTTADKGPYSGKVILSDDTHIKSNRILVGGNSDGNSGVNRIVPVSELILGQSNNFNTGSTLDQDGNTIDMGLAGNLLVGNDPSARGAAGVLKFRSGLTNPVLNVGNLNLSADFGDVNRNGFEVGTNRSQGSATAGSRAFGVLDTTSASGGSDGAFNGFFASMPIGRGSTNAHGAVGMFSMDKGAIDSNNTMFLGRTTNALNSQLILGVFNLGVKGGPNDAGEGSYVTTLNMNVGSREQVTIGMNMGVFTLANSATAQAERVLVGINTVADAVGSHSVGIVNLTGGTLTTAQLKGGTDTEVGTVNTRLVNFNGGTLKVKPATTFASAFMGNLTNAYVYGGGATIDTNGENVTITQGLEAPAGNGLSTVTVDNGGSGYRSAPVVMISGGGGTGATAVAQINSSGVVTGVTITNPGTGYTSAPTIELIANGGTTYAQSLLPYGGTPATVSSTLSANTSGGLTKNGAGTLTLNGVNTYTGPTVVNAGKVVLGKSLTTSSSVSALNDSAIELSDDGTHNKFIKTGEIALGSNASIDLRDNKLLTTTPVGTFDGSAYSGVQGQVARAYNFGAWDQPGLKTSMPEAGFNAGALSGTTTIATATAEQVMFIAPSDTAVFQGQTVTGATTIAMYTYAGDLNMDGFVDGADYGVIDNYVQFPGTDGYVNGDFNYDGVIDGADYGVIDNTIQLQGAPFPGVVFGAAASASSGDGLAGVTAVPEPSACGFAILGAAALVGRRRRAPR
jgi:autotransporter-associated beta strand protein